MWYWWACGTKKNVTPCCTMRLYITVHILYCMYTIFSKRFAPFFRSNKQLTLLFSDYLKTPVGGIPQREGAPDGEVPLEFWYTSRAITQGSNFGPGLWAWSRSPINSCISMYATNECYNKWHFKTNYFCCSIPHCIIYIYVFIYFLQRFSFHCKNLNFNVSGNKKEFSWLKG